MPSVIEMEKSNKRRRLERLSRHAIFQMNDEIMSCGSVRLVLIRGAHATSRAGCGDSPQRTWCEISQTGSVLKSSQNRRSSKSNASYRFAVAEPDRALGERGDL